MPPASPSTASPAALSAELPAAVAAPAPAHTAPDERRGMLQGFIGVAIFSLTLPFTRMAVADIDPLLLTLARALGAAVLAACWLRRTRAPRPPRSALPGLAVVAAGCVLGFPLLSSIAMRGLPASHGAVLVGVLPLCTALCAAVRGDERPSPAFWLLALLGAGLVAGFALLQGGGGLHAADLLMFGAVAAAAAGYAEGGRLARTMDGVDVIGWALLLAAPPLALLLVLAVLRDPALATHLAQAGWRAWLGFAYVTVFSMFVGFVFWYRGLALGGVARVGQVQLLQPFLTLAGAAALLGEPLTPANCGFALAVIAVVALGRRARVRR